MKTPLAERQLMNKVAFAAYKAASNHDAVGTEHLLLAIASEDDGPVGEALRALGVTPDRIRPLIDSLLSDSEQQALNEAGIDSTYLRSQLESEFGNNTWTRPWRRRRKVMQINGETEGYKKSMVETMLGRGEGRTTKQLLLRVIEVEGRGSEILSTLGVTSQQVREKLTQI